MRKKLIQQITAALAASGLLTGIAQAAPPASPQKFVTANVYFDITGTGVGNLTNSAKFPNKPDGVYFYPYFELWATGDITTPAANANFDNYGAKMAGYFYPPSTGDYTFWVNSDDNSELYLSTDSDPKNKKLIARETAWSNPREYVTSGGNSDLTAKDSSQFTATQWPSTNAVGGGKITLQAGSIYYIEALMKEGGGGDNLSVAVADPAGAIDSTSPIPGKYLSSDRTNGPAAIVTQPQTQTVPERGSATFRVNADGTPPLTFQWKKNGNAIADATNATYVVSSATMADNNSKFSVVVTGGQGSVTSSDAVLTVSPDTTAPSLLSAKGKADLVGIVLVFTEKLDQATAENAGNYTVSSANGSIAVSAAALSPDGTAVTLTTAAQTLGTKYNVTVKNVKDTAATPNTIGANNKAVFFPMGKLVEDNGLIVFEAENYDRNLDGLWVPDTTRGIPSGGVSMVNPNGAGGSATSTVLEYDVNFKEAGTWIVWYRASGDNGNDDSGWFYLDGDKPTERVDGNQDSMTGFSGALDFVWRSSPQDGGGQFTVEISAAGAHVIGLARREDGAFFDKFVLTKDPAFTPTGFGPPETRQGTPAAPTVSLTAPAAGQTFSAGANISFAANAAGGSGLNIVRVEFTANGNTIGAATASPYNFTWTNATAGIYVVRAKAVDEIGVATVSDPVAITVGTPPPQALLVVGTDSDPVLNASDAGVKARLEAQGWQVTVVQAPASKTGDADGKQLIVISSTVNSGDVGNKFQSSTVPVVVWEQALEDNFLMTLDDATLRGTAAAQTTIEIVKADHPLAGGLSAGVHTVTKEAQDLSWGTPNANAVIIATIAGDPTKAAIYGYDKGAKLIDGTTAAPARRVLFFTGNNGFAALTDDGIKLFDAAVQWASGVAPKPRAKIAWVSFHAGDDAPSSAAATAGFTQAPDVGYTSLLKASGYDVTRVVTSGTPDTTLLNAFDLVIVSRSVPSGDYQNAPSTAAWNGITKPMMILGGYVLRANRLGFITGNTIPDTAGPVTLAVNNPAHPIFAGVALDANKTMVNTYAAPVTFNGTTQRGISVNTDPPATGGTVLATIGTAGDPAAGGMVIGEWQAGATLSDASADKLGGHRLVFLTGSREASTLTSQGAGIYDLAADGAKLFLNAVNYMAAGTPPASTKLSVTLSAGNITITWTGAGTLESSSSVRGPWAPVTNAASPYKAQTTGSAQFFRVRQ